MKSLLALVLFASLNVYAHGGEDEPRIVLEPESATTITSTSVNYRFQLFDTLNKKPVTQNDLTISHEKYLHFIVYDPGLVEFQHVHPTFDGQYWNVTLNFQVNGNYWAWAQGALTDGNEFSSSARADVNVNKQASPDPSLSDVRSGVDGVSQVTVSATKLYAGKFAMLDIDFSRTDGTAPIITPYLGALAHVVAVTEDGDSLIHVHAMDGDTSTSGMLHVSFPTQGFYRLWVEFMDGGTVKKVALAVQVY